MLNVQYYLLQLVGGKCVFAHRSCWQNQTLIFSCPTTLDLPKVINQIKVRRTQTFDEMPKWHAILFVVIWTVTKQNWTLERVKGEEAGDLDAFLSLLSVVENLTLPRSLFTHTWCVHLSLFLLVLSFSPLKAKWNVLFLRPNPLTARVNTVRIGPV